jgi:hypothetical protein
MQKLKAVIGSTALALVTASSTAVAESHTQRLRGDFAFSGGAACLVSPAPIGVAPAGFTADLVPVRGPGIPPAFALSFSVQGVRSFNGDGTGSFVGRTVSVREAGTGANSNPGGAQANDISGHFTYSVAADGTVTIDHGPIDSTSVAGAQTTEHRRITDVPTFIGRLSRDRDLLSFATFNPGVETVTNLGTGHVESVRICHRERTGIRIRQ